MKDTYDRFPARADQTLNPDVWDISHSSVGLYLKDLNKALELGKNLNYFVTREIIKIKLDDNQSAINDLNEALKMDSTDNNANAYLGVAYTQIDKPDMAIPFLKNAVRLNKEDYYSSYYLGLAYFDKTRYKEAELAFNSGIEFCTAHSFYPLMYEMRGKSFYKIRTR